METQLTSKPDAAKSAAAFGCTIEQAKRLLAKNADGFAWMAAKAKAKGGRYNGFTAAELLRSEAEYRAASL